MPDSRLPLAGIRVVDFTRLLPGPWCTQILADMGADVVKIEAPANGDPSRHNPPRQREHSAYFAAVNRGKRGVALDLRDEPGREAARRLIARADVVVESFAVGVAGRLGIDYPAARGLRPDLIYCSITGFGQDGPLAGSAGHDLVVQATTGVLGVGTPGAMPGFQAADYAGASFALIGILAALQRRHATGEGAYLDVAMHDALLAMADIALTTGLSRASGGTGAPAMEVWGGNPRYCIYPTRDGRHVAVSLLETRLWARFCEVIGRRELVFDDERPEDRHSDHGERADLYRHALGKFFAAHSTDEIDLLMREHDIPICPVLDADQALASPHAAARGMIYREHDPHDGDVVRIGNPLTRAGLASSSGHRPPRLGEHTAEVLSEVGLEFRTISAEDAR